ncbi:MAG: hypothetical protein U1C46_02655 [Bacteroidales bacterium]|nr:hypothetical protein [Bacteroidales bacterium]
MKTNNPRKDVARHASDGLMKAFVGRLARILKPEGKIALVLPTERFDKFQNLLDQSELFILRFCKVLPRIGLAPTRLLLELVKLPVDMIQEEALVLRGRDNQYTDQYKELTREFYLFLNE